MRENPVRFGTAPLKSGVNTFLQNHQIQFNRQGSACVLIYGIKTHRRTCQSYPGHKVKLLALMTNCRPEGGREQERQTDGRLADWRAIPLSIVQWLPIYKKQQDTATSALFKAAGQGHFRLFFYISCRTALRDLRMSDLQHRGFPRLPSLYVFLLFCSCQVSRY